MIDVQSLECSTAQMASMLNVNVRTLQKLGQEGWIEGRRGRDQWSVALTVQSYVTHLMLERQKGRR